MVLAGLIFAACSALALFSMPLAIGLAKKFEFIAPANDDVATHNEPVPLLGGTAFAIGFLLVSTACGFLLDPFWLYAALAVLILAVLALYKDKVQTPVSPFFQLAVQAMAASLLVMNARDFSIFGSPTVGFIVPLVLGLLLLNAWNFLDVMDGLAGSLAFFTCACFSIIALMAGDHGLLLTSLALAGGTLGFLYYNLPPAKVFMGDVGSFCLGAAFIAFGLRIAPRLAGADNMALILLFFAPLFEMTFVAARRLLLRKSIFQGDDSHFGLRLLNRGWSNYKVLALVNGACLLAGLAGVFLFVYR